MIFLFCATMLFAQTDNDFLPKWMTPAESLRIHEIGKGHVITTPPGGWVETPAEFDPLRGVFVTWRYGTYNSIFREIVREVVEVTKAYIIARSSSEQNNITNYLQSGGVPLDSVEFEIFSNNSIWIRDYGPWFIRRENNTEAIIDFQYNRPRPSDDTIPWRIGQAWGIPVYGSPLEHPGGNFMVDGLGSGFVSNLIYQENPSYSGPEIDTMMWEYNGLEQFIVVQRIRTEYTGHIDLWTKMLNDTLVLIGEYAPGHPNDTVLDNRAALISTLNNREGFSYRVARIPMPWSMSDAPPTYLNSLIVNNKVLVPTWGLTEDDTALFIYQQLMPGYDIVGINCAAMSGSGGAIHCITMQVPSSRFIHIQHYALPDTNDSINPYRVRARIITSSALLVDSTLIYYRVNNGSFNPVALSAIVDTPGVYAGFIPAQSAGDTIDYYLQARNTEGMRKTSPVHVPPQYYTFAITGGPAVSEQEVSPLEQVSVNPNPGHDFLTFAFTLTHDTPVQIDVFNVLGQHIASVIDRTLRAGSQHISWDFRDKSSEKIPAGAYFYRITTTQGTATGKVLLTK